MKLPAVLATRTPYIAWLIASAILLAVACFLDPYIFGFTAFASAGLSLLAAVLSAFSGWRTFLWGVFSTIPTVVAFVVLSTYSWA